MGKIGLDFDSRNWLLLARLSKMGFEPDDARKVARALEKGTINFKQVLKHGKKILGKIDDEK